MAILKDQINKIKIENTTDIECYEIKRYLIDKNFNLVVQLPYYADKTDIISRKKSTLSAQKDNETRIRFGDFASPVPLKKKERDQSRATSNVQSMKSFKYDHASIEEFKEKDSLSSDVKVFC